MRPKPKQPKLKNRFYECSYDSKLDPERKIAYRIPKSPKWHETLYFTKLRNEWYHRLKQSGFDDIEDFIPYFVQDAPYLKSNAAELRRKALRAERNGMYAYMSLARDFLNEGRFQAFGRDKQYRAATSKKVWALHCDGWTNPQIAEALKLTGHQVTKYIYKVRKDMYDHGKLQRAIWNAYSPGKTWRQIKKETGASKRQIMLVLEEIEEIRNAYFGKISEAAMEVIGLSNERPDFDDSGKIEPHQLYGDWINE